MSDTDATSQQSRTLCVNIARALASVSRFRAIITPVEHHQDGRKVKTGMLDVRIDQSGALAYMSKRAAQVDLDEISDQYTIALHEHRVPLVEAIEHNADVANSPFEYDELATAIEHASFMAPLFIVQDGTQSSPFFKLVLASDNAVRFSGTGAKDQAAELRASLESFISQKRSACLRELRALLTSTLATAFPKT